MELVFLAGGLIHGLGESVLKEGGLRSRSRAELLHKSEGVKYLQREDGGVAEFWCDAW